MTRRDAIKRLREAEPVPAGRWANLRQMLGDGRRYVALSVEAARELLAENAQLDADREAAERDVEQATWEEAVANGEPWADTTEGASDE